MKAGSITNPDAKEDRPSRRTSRPTGASAPSILRAPGRPVRPLTLKGRKYWVHAWEGLDASKATRVRLAHISDAQAKRILSAPLTGRLPERLRNTMVDGASDGGYGLPSVANEPLPRRMVENRAVEDWQPRRIGSYVVLDGVEIRETPDPVRPDRRVIFVRKPGLRPFRFALSRKRPGCRLSEADGIAFSLGRGGKIAAVDFRLAVGRYQFHRLAHEPFILDAAWRRVRAGGPGTGVDGVSARNVTDPHGFIGMTALRMKTGRVAPKPLKQVYVPKSDRVRWRTLAIPTLRDRLIQAAILEVIAPLYEERFLDCSYGFRRGRSTMDAIRRLREYFDVGYRWVISLDLKDYFETIPWPLLKGFLREEIPDSTLVRWIMTQIAAPTKPAPFPTTGDTSNLAPPPPDGSFLERTRGVPQGAPLSPLLGNVHLHRFDLWVAQNRWRMVRYADDITLLARRKGDAERILDNATYFLEQRLGLTVNRQKTSVVNAGAGEPVTALGFELAKGWITISEKNVERCKEYLASLLEQPWPAPYRRYWFTTIAWSWRRYFQSAGRAPILGEMEEWATGTLRAFEERLRQEGTK